MFGESKRVNERNRLERTCMLGPDKVPEKSDYEHVGVKLSILIDDASGVEERLAKARRALNAISGLGIRKNGLTIASVQCSFLVQNSTYCRVWGRVVGTKRQSN